MEAIPWLTVLAIMAQAPLQDKFLYFRLKHKDREAFIKAYDLYLEDIYRFIFFKVGSHEEAEDLTSQVFLKTWDYIQNNEIDPYKSLKSLLYKVARNLVIDFYRKKNSEKDLISHEDIGELQVVDNNQDVHRKMELHDDYSLIENKLFELKDEYREVIILKYINELSIAEIAGALDKTKGNIRVMVYRALKALQEIASASPKSDSAGEAKARLIKKLPDSDLTSSN